MIHKIHFDNKDYLILYLNENFPNWEIDNSEVSLGPLTRIRAANTRIVIYNDHILSIDLN